MDGDSEDDLVTIETAPNIAAAQRLLDLLEAKGVPVDVARSGLQDPAAIDHEPVGFLPVRVQVPRRHAAKAREVIESLREAALVGNLATPSAGVEADLAGRLQAVAHAPGPPEMKSSSRSRRALWLEMGAVVLLYLVPAYYEAWLQLLGWKWNGARDRSFVRTEARWFLYEVGFAAILLSLMSRSGSSWAYFGLSRVRWRVDLLVLVVVLFADRLLFALRAYVMWLWRTGLLPDGTSPSAETALFPEPSGVLESLLFIVSTTVSAFTEELYLRAYIVPRLQDLLRSTWWSVILSALLFSGYHAHHGVHGLVDTLLAGLVYGAAFAFTRRLWPLVAAHAMHNLWLKLT